MSGVGEAPKDKEQSGLVESVKQAGENVVKTVQQKAGGSQVCCAGNAGSKCLNSTLQGNTSNLCGTWSHLQERELCLCQWAQLHQHATAHVCV